MDITNFLQTLIGVSGLVLGATYVVGGLIVNLHISRYGIIQYQVLRVKYLVVGLTYFTNFIAVLLLATVPATLVVTSNLLLQQVFFIASLLASVSLLWLWGKSAPSKSFFFSWRFWVIVGSISSIFPSLVVIKLGLIWGLGKSINYETVLILVQACIAGVLSFVGQTYYYARHLYGRHNVVFGATDPIGTGIPIQVQLTGEKNKISLLANIGVPMLNPETTDKILLLDETDTHYIIGISQDTKLQAVEVAKDIIKAIRYGKDEKRANNA